MKARGVAGEVRVIVKGVHSPYRLPDVIRVQLEISLERPGLERTPVYVMHRDNPDVSMGEFIDAPNQLSAEGLIGAFGGSKWTVARFRDVNCHTAANCFKPLEILNNNLSLAVMERPVWSGCVTANTVGALAFPRSSGTTHLSWSSQAWGYFVDRVGRAELPECTAPDTCFAFAANSKRHERARLLAIRLGMRTHNVATAWVPRQAFPCPALIGSRSPGEIASTLPALRIGFSEHDMARLNLEDGSG